MLVFYGLVGDGDERQANKQRNVGNEAAIDNDYGEESEVDDDLDGNEDEDVYIENSGNNFFNLNHRWLQTKFYSWRRKGVTIDRKMTRNALQRTVEAASWTWCCRTSIARNAQPPRRWALRSRWKIKSHMHARTAVYVCVCMCDYVSVWDGGDSSWDIGLKKKCFNSAYMRYFFCTRVVNKQRFLSSFLTTKNIILFAVYLYLSICMTLSLFWSSHSVVVWRRRMWTAFVTFWSCDTGYYPWETS